MKSEIFDHPNYIGGRYSVLSETGMLPASLMGLNINKFKRFDYLIQNKKFCNSLISNVSGLLTLYNNQKTNSIILNYDEEVRTSVKSNLSSDLKMYKEKEFSRGRDVMRDILDTTSTLEKSAVDALKMVRHLFDE